MDVNIKLGFNRENRLNLWMNLLDITNHSKAEFLQVTEEQLSRVNEVRVIEQDVLRTRANEVFFSSKEMRFLMKRALLKYCAYHSIQYMQGLNEILAPLLLLSRINSLHDESNEDDNDKDKLLQSLDSDDPQYEDLTESDGIELEKTFGLSLAIFEKIVDKISPTVFKWAGVQALQAQLASLHMLLYYFEADLAKLLVKESMSTDIYAQSWFITIFARRLNAQLALYLWDILLQRNCPYFIVIIAVAFLQRHKGMLMKISTEILPQTLVKLNFQSEKEIDEVVQQACRLESLIPYSVISDINRFAFDVSVMEIERSSGLLDLMYRPCLIVEASDVAQALMTKKRSKKQINQPIEKITQPSNEKNLRYLLIDCRSDQDQQQSTFIEGSLIIPPNITEEICNVIQQTNDNGMYDLHLEILSPPAAATIALLWSCRDDDLHFAIYGSGVKSIVESVKTEVTNNNSNNNSNKSENNESKKSTKKIVKDITKSKKSQKKSDLQLPTYKLATAMLIMGFSRVSIIKGYSDTTNTNIPVIIENEDLLPNEMKHIWQGLHSRNDGFASLAYQLCIIHKSVIEKGVIKIPQDILLAEKVRQFYLSKDQKSTKILLDKQINSNLPTIITDNTNNTNNNIVQSKQSFDEKAVSSPHGITALGNILKRLSGFRDEFIENVLISPKPSINVTTANNITNTNNSMNSNVPIDTKDKLIQHTKIQQIEISKVTLVEIQKTFAPTSLVVDDIVAFERKFKFWTKELDIVMELSKRTVRSLTTLTHINKKKLFHLGLTDVASTDSTRTSLSSESFVKIKDNKRNDNISDPNSDMNEGYVMVSDNDEDTTTL